MIVELSEETFQNENYEKFISRIQKNNISCYFTRQFNGPNRNIRLKVINFKSLLTKHGQNFKQHIFRFDR